ncbi:hypothetical protein F383_31507 [Gossypium arboreum]|uniref:Uncharacterized protein n=1 Tax=Gossypium arboreum TaxID=29729 RepID=A0A0B0PNA6_GOSAR|nr:hypothetical protein F383_31507 [Gossypium arboreum]
MFLLQFEQWCRGAIKDQTSRTLLQFRNTVPTSIATKKTGLTTKMCMAWRSYSWSMARVEEPARGCGG